MGTGAELGHEAKGTAIRVGVHLHTTLLKVMLLLRQNFNSHALEWRIMGTL